MARRIRDAKAPSSGCRRHDREDNDEDEPASHHRRKARCDPNQPFMLPESSPSELSATAVDSKRPGQEAKETAERANAPVREEGLYRPLYTCTEHMRSCSAAVIRSRQIGPHRSRQ